MSWTRASLNRQIELHTIVAMQPHAADDGRELRAGIVDALPEIVIVLDGEGTITFAAGSLVSHVRITAAELIGRSAWDFVHPDDLEDAVSSLDYAQTTDEGPVGPFLFRYFDREGDVRSADAVALNRSDDPILCGTIMLVRDVVGQQAVERAFECLAEGGEFEVIAGHMLRAVEETPITGPGWVLRVAWPEAGAVDSAPPRVEVVGLSPAASALGPLAAGVGDWVVDPEAEQVIDPDLSTVSAELRDAMHELGLQSLMAMPVRTPGAPRPDLWLIACNRRVGPATVNERRTIRRYASVLSVAFERLRLQAELRHAAIHDGLTGLANRAAFMAQLAEAHDGVYALLYLDLDGFKPVNDRLGHGAGDEVLTEISRRIAATVPKHDLVARLGGDEFAVLVHDGAPKPAMDLADAIIAAVARPVSVQDEQIVLGVSIGIATGAASELASVLERADGAMYQAKAQGGPGAWRLAEHGDRRVADRRGPR
jgi:diguanylate cyclase (GGDEF)-like protein/PAS domain S-box-containing protein